MKIVILKTIEHLGREGDVKNVADGYARNFLFPRNLAKPATPHALEEVGRLKAAAEKQEAQRLEKLRSWQEAINHLTFEVTLKSRGATSTYGSVSEEKIREFLRRKGVELEKNQIELPEPLKTFGEHTITIKLGKDLEATLKILIQPQQG